MELKDALDQITQIRQQIALTKLFRGFRSTTTLFTAAVAIVVSLLQAVLIDRPGTDIWLFLELWTATAVTCVVVTGASIYLRFRDSDSPIQRELALMTIQQFLPPLVVGGLLTYIIPMTAWPIVWILPSLWMILFGLCILSARQMLPRAIVFVGAFYLLCGLIVLGGSHHFSPFSALAMGLPFIIGQTVSAAILYWQLERNHGDE